MTPARDPKSEVVRWLHGFELANVMIGVIAVAVVFMVDGSGPLHLGVLVGATLGALNLRAMIWLGGKVLHAPKHTRTRYAVIFGLKLAVLIGAVWLAMNSLPVAPLGMMLGFSTLLPAMLLMTVKKSLEPVEAAHKGEHGL